MIFFRRGLNSRIFHIFLGLSKSSINSTWHYQLVPEILIFVHQIEPNLIFLRKQNQKRCFSKNFAPKNGS